MKRFTLICLVGLVTLASGKKRHTVEARRAHEPIKVPVKQTYVHGHEEHLYKKHDFQSKF